MKKKTKKYHTAMLLPPPPLPPQLQMMGARHVDPWVQGWFIGMEAIKDPTIFGEGPCEKCESTFCDDCKDK